jgi:hypothetical protein
MEIVWSGVSGCDLLQAYLTESHTGSPALIKEQ